MKKKFRVLKNYEFKKIINKKNLVKNSSYYIYFFEKNEKHCRVGINVSPKIGIAVIRNKIKRQIKSILQQNFDFNNFTKDLIIYPRKDYFKKNFEKNKNNLLQLIKKME